MLENLEAGDTLETARLEIPRLVHETDPVDPVPRLELLPEELHRLEAGQVPGIQRPGPSRLIKEKMEKKAVTGPIIENPLAGPGVEETRSRAEAASVGMPEQRSGVGMGPLSVPVDL